MNINVLSRVFRVIARRPLCESHMKIICQSTRLSSTSDEFPPIPPYAAKQNETLEVKKARLLYQSRKRGMLENGLLLSTFAAKHLNSMDAQETEMYDTLINQPSNDWEIYYWAIGNKPTPVEYDTKIMNLLKKHAANENMDDRSRQPDLNL